MIARVPRLYSAMISVLALMAIPGLAAAQNAEGVPNALQGFSQNRGKPVQIEAATLEVRDKDKVATFSGNVHVTQGDTIGRAGTRDPKVTVEVRRGGRPFPTAALVALG